VAFATAPDQVTGEMWREMLRASGIDCRLRNDNPSFLGPTMFPVTLVAPEEQAGMALEALESNVDLAPGNRVGDTRDKSR
jgi:hypothetical protein